LSALYFTDFPEAMQEKSQENDKIYFTAFLLVVRGLFYRAFLGGIKSP
jgi:hypothetical protein